MQGTVKMYDPATREGIVVLDTDRSELVLAGGIVALAIVKAVLVALYFMHLKFERRTMGILFASTLILGVILVSVGIGELVLPRPGYPRGVVHGASPQ